MNDSEKKLIKRFLNNDVRAQKQFIEKYKKWVMGVAIKQFKLDVFNAEEIFQIVLLSLIDKDYKVLRAWQGRSKFSTYLTVIVTRACIKYVNKNKNEQPLDESHYEKTQSDNKVSPEDKTHITKQLELIQHYFSQLNSRDQLLLSYRFVDELEPTKIAKILNMKSGAVRKAIHDAVKRLKNKLPFDVTLVILTALIGRYTER